MVIDFHTHAFPDTLAERAITSLVKACGNIYTPCHNGTVSDLQNKMDAFGVDISVVQPVITNPKHTKTLNEWAASIQSDRIISFGGIHPDTDDYKRDINFVCSLGLKGLKFHVEYQGFTLDEPKMLPIYDYAFSKGLIILHHAGFDPAFPPPYHSSPKQFANVAKQMRGGILIAAHLGGQKQWDETERYLPGTGVYLDSSMGFEYFSDEQFLRIFKAMGSDKVLFGSDSPWSKAGEEIKAIEKLPLTKEEKDNFLWGNAKRLLNL